MSVRVTANPSGELPGSVAVVYPTGSSGTTAADEGTALLEEIHAVAPGAKLEDVARTWGVLALMLAAPGLGNLGLASPVAAQVGVAGGCAGGCGNGGGGSGGAAGK